MRTAIPLISEPADALKQRLRCEHNGSPGIPVVTGQSSLSRRAKSLEILG
jgi:hypothetical protein